MDTRRIVRPYVDMLLIGTELTLALLSMHRLQEKKSWSLFDPMDVPKLATLWGKAFSRAYNKYERTTQPVATIPATELWELICAAQIESGLPYILYSDAVNGQSKASIPYNVYSL